MYLEGHVGAFVNSTLVADPDTKQALRNALEREGGWSNKSSTISECRDILEEMKDGEECPFPTPENCANFKVTMRVEKPKILALAKRKVEQVFRRKSAVTAAKLGF